MKRISSELDELHRSIEQVEVELRDMWLENLSNTHKPTNREPEGEGVTLAVSGVSALKFYSNGVVKDWHGRTYEASDIAKYKHGEDYPLRVMVRCGTLRTRIEMSNIFTQSSVQSGTKKNR